MFLYREALKQILKTNRVKYTELRTTSKLLVAHYTRKL
jgi:hypothetical protein